MTEIRWADIRHRPVLFPPEDHEIEKVTGLAPALAALEADNAVKAAQITVLQAENAALTADLERRARVDEARWAFDHLAWPDGRPISPAEKSAAVDVLEADRIARSRDGRP